MPEQTNGLPTTPEPGVYTGIPMADYHQWDCASNSRLSRLIRSPAHLKAYLEERVKETPALVLGRAIHTAVLEPDRFPKRYQRAGQCMAKTKAGHRCSNNGSGIGPEGDQLCGVHMPRTAPVSPVALLAESDYEACLGIRDAAYRKVTSAGLLSGDGEVELSMVWRDRPTGVLCKARWDRYSRDLLSAVDLKTTRDASPRSFERALFNYGYHRQAALYLMAGRHHDIPARHYVIIAVEKEPPYGVAVYRLSDVVVSQVEDQVRALLGRYAECRETGEWPDYPDEVRDLSIPAWAWTVMDEQTAEIEEGVAA